MSDRFSVPHIWSPAYGRPPPQPQHGYPMQSGAPYGMQTMGLPSNYPGGNMPFQPRPPSLSQCLGLPRSMPGGVNSRPQSFNTPMPEGVEMQENGSVYCKNCDKKFPDVSQFRAHEAHHRKCDVDDCSFVGTQRAVNIHREEKHSAVSHLVPSLETPDQIAKWREARRRNFPTAENVDRKKAATREREERGQVARNEVHRHRNGRSNPNHRQRNRQPYQPGPSAGDPVVPQPASTATAQPVGTSSQPPTHTTVQTATPEPLVSGTHDNEAPLATGSTSSGLGLLGSYGSDVDSSDSENQVDMPIKSGTADSPPSGTVHASGVSRTLQETGSDGEGTVAPVSAKQPGAGQSDLLPADVNGDAGVGDESAVDESAVLTALLADAGRLEPSVLPDAMDDVTGKADDMHRTSRQQGQSRLGQRKQNQRQKNKNNQPAPALSKPSLLEKLLAGEVRRERNVLLQCIRHIVRHDFLDQHPRPVAS